MSSAFACDRRSVALCAFTLNRVNASRVYARPVPDEQSSDSNDTLFAAMYMHKTLKPSGAEKTEELYKRESRRQYRTRSLLPVHVVQRALILPTWVTPSYQSQS